MANFFKNYQTQIKDKKEADKKEAEKSKKERYERGQLVNINPYYDSERKTKRYFADYLNEDYVLLAETKKDALNGYGSIYHISIIQ